MNKYIKAFFLISTSALLLLTNNIFAQTTFEGIVKIKMDADDESFFIDYFIKDDNMRIEMDNAEEVAFIMSGEKSLILMKEQKTYMDLNNPMFSMMPGMSGMDSDEEKSLESFDINKYKTGKTQNLLGYECEQWIFNDEEEELEIEAWVTDELGNFMMMKSPMGGGFSPSWSSSLKNKGFFPLLVITREEDGEETSKFEVVNVDQKDLNNDLFSAPSDFEEFKIPGM